MHAIAQGIESGVWVPDDRLPTEDELVQMTGFSLGTVQRALRQRVDRGLVVREHGLGTFAAPSQLRVQDPWHCRFLADNGLGFLLVSSTLTCCLAEQEGGPWHWHFAASAGPSS